MSMAALRPSQPFTKTRSQMPAGKQMAELRLKLSALFADRRRWTLQLLEKQVRLELDAPVVGRETIRLVKKRTPSPHE